MEKVNETPKLADPEYLLISRNIYMAFVGNLHDRIWHLWSSGSINFISDRFKGYELTHSAEIRDVAIAERLLTTGELCSIDPRTRAAAVANFLPGLQPYLAMEKIIPFNIPDFKILDR